MAVDLSSESRQLEDRLPEKNYSRFSLADLCSLLALCVYAYFFFENLLANHWMSSRFTTDDALQQLYPFHEVYHPGLFKGDYVTEFVKGYLSPIHYWLTYAVTMLTADPIMTGHWMMLVQILLTSLFVFLGVRRATNSLAPAFFAVVWLLHTRNLINRFCAGLPRGWHGPILSAYLYFLVSGNHTAILITIALGCLINQPATFVVAVSYGVFLTWKVVSTKTRAEYLKHWTRLAIMAPVFVLLVYFAIKREGDYGTMANLERASKMVEFHTHGGRFPMLPFPGVLSEIKEFGLQSVVTKWAHPGQVIHSYRDAYLAILLILGAGLVIAAQRLKVNIWRVEYGTYLFAVLLVYLASRQLAFYLYVPNRHLQFPLAIFCIFGFTTALWNVFDRGLFYKIRRYSLLRVGGLCSLILLGGLIWNGSKHGLYGKANINTDRKAIWSVWKWFQENTPTTALIAGQPEHIDGAQLFGMRRALITTETAHPFYDKYYKEAERRLRVTWQAYYAKDWTEFLNLLEPEGVTHFVFRKIDFYPWALKRATYFRPLNAFVNELANARPPNEYAFKSLPKQQDLVNCAFMPYRDDMTVIIDLKVLREYLDSGKLKNCLS